MKLYSYVVDHDTGFAPNPYFGVCTLCLCKYRERPGKPRNIVELAEEGDWIAGTGGADLRKSAGHGKLVYAMRVDKKLTREQYHTSPRFAKKKPSTTGTYDETRGDNKPPRNGFEKRDQFVLISRHFYYFGSAAISIPRDFPNLEKRGPGFRSDFDPQYIVRFVRWLERKKAGRHGEPCQKPAPEPKRGEVCKSSC
jgi:hypothetical protein